MNISQKANAGDYGKPVLAYEQIEEDFQGRYPVMQPSRQALQGVDAYLGARRKKKRGMGSLWTDIRNSITGAVTGAVQNLPGQVVGQVSQTPTGQQAIQQTAVQAKKTLLAEYGIPIAIGAAGVTGLVVYLLARKK